jgi:hypothetical protein
LPFDEARFLEAQMKSSREMRIAISGLPIQDADHRHRRLLRDESFDHLVGGGD